MILFRFNRKLSVSTKRILLHQLIQRKYSKTAARLVPFYTDRVEKPGGSRKVEFQDIFGLLSEEKASFTVAGSGILLSSICSLAIPTIFGNVIDAFSLDQEIIEVLKTSALQLFGIAIVNGIATFVKSSTLDLIGQKVGMRLRRRLFTTIITQNVSFFDENTSGELANRISHDVHEVAEHLVEHTSMFLTASVHTIIASSYLVCISPSLSSITLMVFPTICVGAVFYGRYVEIFSRQYLNALANSTQTATEKFSAIKTVRSFSGEKVEMKRFGKQIDEALSFARYWCYLEGFYLGSIAAISAGTMLAVIWYGSDMVLSKILSVGNLASYALYAQELNNSTIDLTEGIAGIMRAKGSASRVFELLSHNNPQKSGNYIPKGGIRGVIEFRNVNFAFPRRPSLTVLHNFSLVLDAGQKICITGKSGCGKSTILELLEGFYDSYEGGIYVDDVNLRNYDPSWLRNQIISVRQDVALFTGTIYENICYGLPKSSIEDVQNAARISLVHDFIVSLPLGYDTMVGERSGQLSGGQRQRIAVARAILMKPKVLLLDEVTSAQDSVNEEDLIGSVLRQVDRVVVLENGNVTLTGTYDKVKSSLHSTGG